MRTNSVVKNNVKVEVTSICFKKDHLILLKLIKIWYLCFCNIAKNISNNKYNINLVREMESFPWNIVPFNYFQKEMKSFISKLTFWFFFSKYGVEEFLEFQSIKFLSSFNPVSLHLSVLSCAFTFFLSFIFAFQSLFDGMEMVITGVKSEFLEVEMKNQFPVKKNSENDKMNAKMKKRVREIRS